MTPKKIVDDAEWLAWKFEYLLSEYLSVFPSGNSGFWITPQGDIEFSDGIWYNECDYHNHLSAVVKIIYPAEAWDRWKEYNLKYPILPFGTPIPSEQVIARHYEEMEIRDMAFAEIDRNRVRKICEEAVQFFTTGYIETYGLEEIESYKKED